MSSKVGFPLYVNGTPSANFKLQSIKDGFTMTNAATYWR